MSARIPRLAALGLLLLDGGCTLYDSGKARIALEIVGPTSVADYLRLRVVAPSRVNAVSLTVDGVPTWNGGPTNEEIQVDVRGLALGPHHLGARVDGSPDVVPAAEVSFFVGRPLVASWTQAPRSTFTFSASQVFHLTFSEPLDAASKLALQAGTVVESLTFPWLAGTPVPFGVADLGDGRRFDVSVPDADLLDQVQILLPAVTDLDGVGAAPPAALWRNTPLAVTLTSDVIGPRVTAPSGLVQFTVTLSGRTTRPVYLDRLAPQAATGNVLSFTWDSRAAPDGVYTFAARAERSDYSSYYSNRVSFWVAPAPPPAPTCRPSSSKDLLHLAAREAILCDFARPLDEATVGGITLVDGGGNPIPATAAPSVYSALTCSVTRTSPAGLPGPGRLLLGGLRDAAGWDVPPSSFALEWPAWLQVGDVFAGADSLRNAGSAISCAAQAHAPAKIAVASSRPDSVNIWTFGYGGWTDSYVGFDWRYPVSSPPALAAFQDSYGNTQFTAAWRGTDSSSSVILPSGIDASATSVSGRPAAAMDPATRRALVAYVDGTTVVVRRLANTGWIPEGAALSPGGTPEAISLAVDATGRAAVACSLAGAISVWKLGPSGWAAVGGPIAGPAGAAAAAPSLGMAPGGNPVVAYQTAVGGIPSVLVSRWDGASWVPLGAALNGDPAAGSFDPSLAIDPAGAIHVALADDASGGRIVRVRSFDGSSWTLAGGTPPGGPCAAACEPALAVCPGGVPVVTWMEPSQPILVHQLNTW